MSCHIVSATSLLSKHFVFLGYYWQKLSTHCTPHVHCLCITARTYCFPFYSYPTVIIENFRNRMPTLEFSLAIIWQHYIFFTIYYWLTNLSILGLLENKKVLKSWWAQGSVCIRFCLSHIFSGLYERRWAGSAQYAIWGYRQLKVWV